MGKLTNEAVKKAKPNPDKTARRFQDGDGLTLLVKPSGSKYWALRVMKDGKRIALGLGRYPEVGLADARIKSAVLRGKVKAGVDVLSDKRASEAQKKVARDLTFEVVAKLTHEARDGVSDKTNANWLARLEQHAFPAFGSSPVDKVSGAMIVKALEPVWYDKPETARRLRRAISSVLKYAHARGWRAAVPDLPDLTKDAFPTPQKVVEHHPAVSYDKAAAVVAAIRAKPETIGRLALLFTVYTAARSGETRRATWDQIDLANATWSVPGANMKKKRDHVVPLSAPALAILERMAALRTSDDADAAKPDALIFPGARNRPMSDMTLGKAHKLIDPATSVHGWRSTFKDWASETTAYASDISEAALSHLVGSATMRAYQRGTMLDKRRDMMADWAAYLGAVPAAAGGVSDGSATVIAFEPRRAAAK